MRLQAVRKSVRKEQEKERRRDTLTRGEPRRCGSKFLQEAGEREEEGYINEGRTEKMWLFVSMQTDYNRGWLGKC